MAHQPDVQKQQQHQGQHQRLQELQNIVYIHSNHQNYRNQNYQFSVEEQNNLVRNQLFQQQNAGFGQLENHCPFVSNGHFSSPNSSTTLIQQSFERNKNKNGSTVFRNNQFPSEIDTSDSQERSNGTFQLTTANCQNLNYQQSSQLFLPNIANQFQVNDILVSAYQSSGSSESSEESSISNISQSQYSAESNGLLNSQFEFSAPFSTSTQVSRNFQQLQQKDGYLDNYRNLLHQDSQIPRCDSSKSEAAESTCSSLSSGSAESQSENENTAQVPVLVNPVLNNNANCSILQSYQTNTHNNIHDFSNQVHHNQTNDLINQKIYNNQLEQNLINTTNFYGSMISTDSTISSIDNMLPSNNETNNLVLMLPNQPKNIQSCLVANPSILPSPSTADILNTSKLLIQNQKANQQKIYSVINVPQQISQRKINPQVQMSQDAKFNNKNIQENCINHMGSKNGEKCGTSEENRNISTTINTNVIRNAAKSNIANVNFSSSGGKLFLIDKVPSESKIFGNATSQIYETSDSSVINSSFIQNKHSIIPIENENSAMFSNETSDKSISQCISDVNSSLVDSSNVFLVKNDEKGVFKNICYGESSAVASCLPANSSVTVIPVPTGWKRLLVEGSIIYLSPSNIALSSIEQVKMYLQTGGTCKCGLECPLHCDSVFNFNPTVISRPWDASDSELTRLCNHKRKAPVPVSSSLGTDKNFKVNRKDWPTREMP